MNFTIGICLTCSNQLLSQSSPAQTAMIAEGRQEGRKAGSLSVFWRHQPLETGKPFNRSRAYMPSKTELKHCLIQSNSQTKHLYIYLFRLFL